MVLNITCCDCLQIPFTVSLPWWLLKQTYFRFFLRRKLTYIESALLLKFELTYLSYYTGSFTLIWTLIMVRHLHSFFQSINHSNLLVGRPMVSALSESTATPINMGVMLPCPHTVDKIFIDSEYIHALVNQLGSFSWSHLLVCHKMLNSTYFWDFWLVVSVESQLFICWITILSLLWAKWIAARIFHVEWRQKLVFQKIYVHIILVLLPSKPMLWIYSFQSKWNEFLLRHNLKNVW